MTWSRSVWRPALGGLAFAVCFVFTALGAAAAQRTGTVTGMVTDQATLRPVPGVQIIVVGTTIRTVSNASGRYELQRVPPGEVTIQARIIGYAMASQTTVMGSGAAAELDFTLREQAITLNEIVVTGTAVATERRKVGNSIATVNAGLVVDKLSINTVDELLKGRTAGIQMHLSSGTVGTGGRVQIRGLTSLSLANDPVVYIDGIRVNSKADALNFGEISIGGQDISRLQDLNPSEIERIEIVKGAAAASLYGTQGSNGVIQIFTKRGHTGAPQWTFEVEQGFERTPTDTFPGRLFDQFVGPTGFQARDPKETVGNGYHSRYFASVAGGSDDVNYFVSGGYKTEEGSIAPETMRLRQATVRANIDAVINPKLRVHVSTGLVSSRLRVPDNDNALHGTYSQYASGIPYTATEDRPYGERFGSFEANSTLENRQTVLRNTTGVTIAHNPSDVFQHRLTAGIDWFSEELTKFFPFAYEGSGHAFGDKTNQHRSFRDATVEYRATLSNDIATSLTSELSVGFQGNFTNTIKVRAFGENFPAPGVETVSAGAISSGFETRVEEVNAGVFFQETVGLIDKFFLTGGLRVDGNSAFGNEFDYQVYPKASVAYDISQESFWPTGFWPSMKLRFAFGTSGLAPAQFAADRTYQAIAAQLGATAVTPLNVGDPNLGPERSEEFEAGFDGGLWNDRLGLEMNVFFQTTKDAILFKQFPPSDGFLNAQLTNIGEVKNRGIEIALRGLWVQTPSWQWETSFQYSRTSSEITDMGGVAPFRTSGISGVWIKEGYPVQGVWGNEQAGWDPATRTHSAGDTLVYKGQTGPKWFGSITSNLRVGRFGFNAMADYAGGHIKTNFSRWWSIRVRTGDEYLALVDKPSGDPTAASDSLLNQALVLGQQFFTEPADFIALRELALTFDVPDSWFSRFGFGRTSLRLSARNVKIFSGFAGISPETEWNGAVDIARGGDFDTIPPPRIFLFTLRTTL